MKCSTVVYDKIQGISYGRGVRGFNLRGGHYMAIIALNPKYRILKGIGSSPY